MWAEASITYVNLPRDFEGLREVVQGRLLQYCHGTYRASSSVSNEPKYLAARSIRVLVSWL
jgi:hypothetical protein